MYNTRSRFVGTETLEFTTEEQRAIRAAERTRAYPPREISVAGVVGRLIALIVGLIVLEHLGVALIIGIHSGLSPSSGAQSTTHGAQAPMQFQEARRNFLGIEDLPLPPITTTWLMPIMPQGDPQAETVLQTQAEPEPNASAQADIGTGAESEEVTAQEQPRDAPESEPQRREADTAEKAEFFELADSESREGCTSGSPVTIIKGEPEQRFESRPRPPAHRSKARSFFRGIGKGLDWLLEDTNGVIVVSQPWPSRRP